MPAKSPFPDVEAPNVDLWGLMFDRKEKGFSANKGMLFERQEEQQILTTRSDIPHGRLGQEVHICRGQSLGNNFW
jgi:hypothetical protein